MPMPFWTHIWNAIRSCEFAGEVTITKDFVLVTGEVHSVCRPDIDHVVKATLRRIGYDSQESGFNVDQCEILNKLHEQSPGDRSRRGERRQGQ